MALFTTFEEKKAYFNRVKSENFRESSRLEGIVSQHTNHHITNKKEIALARQAILNRYSHKSL